jgi:hypothetical protein
VKTTTIADWQSLASIAEEFKTENGIFRGVGDAQYELVPKIGRPDISKNPFNGSNVGYSPDFEKRCIERFKREARPHMGIEPASHLDWLSTAQHHGLPTCLLDHKFPDRAYKPANLTKWVIPSKYRFTLKVILNKCGFNEASLFPDLDGIASHVGWLLKWYLL